MKVLKESKEHINIFKQAGWSTLAPKSTSDKYIAKLEAETSSSLGDEEVTESLLTEDKYSEVTVGTCFRVPNDPNRTVYEIDRIEQQNGIDVAIFGSHGHEFHTEYESSIQTLKDAIADGKLELVTSEQEKQDLRKY